MRCARITRQTLRIVAEQQGFGRLMFDIGLPTDRLAAELRLRLKMDIEEGVTAGLFTVADVDLATAIVAGAITGLALDLHRGVLSFANIDTATAQLLTYLGLDGAEAERLAHAAFDFPPTLEWPMRWLALPPVLQRHTNKVNPKNTLFPNKIYYTPNRFFNNCLCRLFFTENDCLMRMDIVNIHLYLLESTATHEPIPEHEPSAIEQA